MSDQRLSNDRSEGGAILVLTALLLVVLMGMAALAVDAANAWSTKRLAQNNADMAALSAVVAIPHTYLPGGPPPTINLGVQGAGSVVAQEVTRITGVNSCPAPCATASDISQVGDEFELRIDLDTASENAFAQAIGAADAMDVHATATAMITANYPELAVLPIGFSSLTAPSYCRLAEEKSTSRCTGGAAVIPIWMGNPATACEDRLETGVYHMINGLGFLIDVDALGSSRPDSLQACNAMHDLTMPTGVRRIAHRDVAALTRGGLANGRLAGDTTAAWDLLPDAPVHTDCLREPIELVAETDVREASRMMSTCLQHTPVLDLARVGEDAWRRRLVWGLGINSDTSGRFTGWVPIWLHAYVDSSGAESLDPSANLQGITFYLLEPAMLGGFAGLLEPDPGGIDNLDFELTD